MNLKLFHLDGCKLSERRMKGNYKVKPIFLHFNELGDYENLDFNFNTEKEAMEKLERLKKDCPKDIGYFAFIAKVKFCEREEGKEE